MAKGALRPGGNRQCKGSWQGEASTVVAWTAAKRTWRPAPCCSRPAPRRFACCVGGLTQALWLRNRVAVRRSSGEVEHAEDGLCQWTLNAGRCPLYWRSICPHLPLGSNSRAVRQNDTSWLCPTVLLPSRAEVLPLRRLNDFDYVHNPGHADYRFRWMPSTHSRACRPVVPARRGRTQETASSLHEIKQVPHLCCRCRRDSCPAYQPNRSEKRSRPACPGLSQGDVDPRGPACPAGLARGTGFGAEQPGNGAEGTGWD